MYARFVKLTFMNDFSKEAASSLLVELGKTKGFAAGMLFRMSVDISLRFRKLINIVSGQKW